MTLEEATAACDELRGLALLGDQFDDISLARVRSILQDFRRNIHITQDTRMKLYETAGGFNEYERQMRRSGQYSARLLVDLLSDLERLCGHLARDLEPPMDPADTT